MKNLSNTPTATDTGSKNDLKPLTEVLADLHKDGFTIDFQFREGRLVPIQDPSKAYDRQSIQVVNFYRFEGETDPADAAILYALETADGIKGTIVNGYGVDADGKLDAFLGDAGDKKVD